MATFTVTALVRETVEVEADTDEEAIEIAQNIDSADFSFIEATWSAEKS